MKKLLSLLAATGLVASAGSVAVACNKKAEDKTNDTNTETIFDLSKTQVDHLIVGNRVNGVYNRDKAPGEDGFVITEESVLYAFDQLNGQNLTTNDVTIKIDSQGEKGAAGVATITAKDDSKKALGTKTFTLNSKLDPDQIFKNKNVGVLKLPKVVYEKYNDLLADSSNKMGLASVIFEQIGGANPVIEPLAQVIAISGLQAMMVESQLTNTTYTINEMPQLGGVFLGKKLTFNYTVGLDDRVTLQSAHKSKEDFKVKGESLSDSTNNFEIAKKELYSSFEDDFKSKVSEEDFIKFTKLTVDGDQNYQIVSIPGSENLYAHDSMWLNTFAPQLAKAAGDGKAFAANDAISLTVQGSKPTLTPEIREVPESVDVKLSKQDEDGTDIADIQIYYPSANTKLVPSITTDGEKYIDKTSLIADYDADYSKRWTVTFKAKAVGSTDITLTYGSVQKTVKINITQ
ncbi:hypothetical protein SHELI_v1c01340 [Spiroplasma helicoides]|uniref:Lipoprotein n=1 Tax=Spiroplasma helicoides TaxID=216938 RepID=A0A1B3SJI1_9MOLU|nr:lipoprotein [Spiroplasma helicoides]AOG60089.1 hypothetical protein SHELI_v1c01340 [Spiroplasma helicoides]